MILQNGILANFTATEIAMCALFITFAGQVITHTIIQLVKNQKEKIILKYSR